MEMASIAMFFLSSWKPFGNADRARDRTRVMVKREKGRTGNVLMTNVTDLTLKNKYSLLGLVDFGRLLVLRFA